MRRIQKSAIMPYTAAQMFQLVNDIEAYPAFLPWCRLAEVLDRSETMIQGRLVLAKGGLEKSFITCNTLTPSTQMVMELVDGPFKHLKGVWRFNDMVHAECQVALDLQFEFSNKLVAIMFGPAFQQAASTLVEAFVKRADEIYGS